MGHHKEEKHDGLKSDYKGRIVVRGCQETDSPASESPTVQRESLKIFLTTCANLGFFIIAMDVSGAYLQSKDMERVIHVKPSTDLAKQ